MKDIIKEGINNDGKIFELKPDCFKKMTEEEKQKHTKYAKTSLAYSIISVFIAIVGLLEILIADSIIDKVLGILMLFVVLGNCCHAITFAMSELQINKRKITKVAYILSLAVCIPCFVMFIVGLIALF